MKFAILAASIATLAPLVSAAGYQAAWTITGDKCDGQISLGEYTATPNTCTPKDCMAVPQAQNFSTKTTCAETHTGAAKEVLGANNKPYVLVEVYKADSNCSNAFDIAIGVTADGVCYPGTAGTSSFNVTWSAETGTVWLQYATPDCTGDETRVEFPNAAADGTVCTAGFLKALAVAPESGAAETNSSSGSGTMAPDATTMAPDATTMAPDATTAPPSNSTGGDASTPAPTTSGASAAFVSATAVATFAVAAALA